MWPYFHWGPRLLLGEKKAAGQQKQNSYCRLVIYIWWCAHITLCLWQKKYFPVMGDSTFRHVYNLLKNSQAVNQKNMVRSEWKELWNTGAWRPRSGCDGRIIAKVLIIKIRQICAPSNLPEFLLLKLLPLSYHHSHFWAATLDFTTFLCCLFFAWAAPFFTAWLFLCRYFYA